MPTSPFDQNTLMSPRDPSIVCRNASSARSPSTSASTSGASGYVELLEHVADDAEHQHHPDVEHRVVHRVGADRAGDQDHRRDDRERNAQDRGEQRHRRQHDDQPGDVAEVHAGDQSPDEVLVLDEQQRPRLQPPDHQAAEQHRGGRRAGNAERQHRQQRARSRGVRGGLRRDHAFDRALAELVADRARISWRGRSP